MRRNNFLKTEDSFTLVELLVVIGILAILTAAVVIVLNPAELLRQSRDSQRITDLASVNKAIQLLLSQNPSISLGNASTVYISIADSSSTCGSLGLPALPAGYSYSCTAAGNAGSISGNGWIPVDFSATNVQNLPKLPLDPASSAAAGLYYAYMPNPAKSTFELTATFESQKYRIGGSADKASTDGGNTTYLYEKGSDLSLSPINDAGLVGWWPMDEGSGTAVLDKSGNGNNGTRENDTSYAAGIDNLGLDIKSGGYVHAPNSSFLNFGTGSFAIAGWGKFRNFDYPKSWFMLKKTVQCYTNGIGWDMGHTYSSNALQFCINDGVTHVYTTLALDSGFRPGENINKWVHIAVIVNRPAGRVQAYINGIKQSNEIDISSVTGSVSNTEELVMGTLYGWNTDGILDDIRLYNRTLSAAEVKAIYNATK
jgi:type II secretory pathway pseudopilin PulG